MTVEDQHRLYGDEVTLICGPGLGPEGSLVERARAGGLDLRIVPELQRSIHPWRDWSSYRRLLKLLARNPAANRPHAQLEGRHPGPRGRGPSRHSRRPHDPRRGVSLRPESARAPPLYRRREMGRPALPAADQRLRRHDRPLRAGRHRAARAVRHDLQRHGGRAVLESAASAGSRPRGTGIPARARRHHEGGAAVSSQGTRIRDRGGRKRRATDIPTCGSCSSATASSAASSKSQIARAGLSEAFVFAGLVPPSQGARVDPCLGHHRAHQPVGGTGPRAAAGADRG